MPRFDATNSECFLYVYREGLLSPIGHDLKLQVSGFIIELDEHRQSLRAEFRADSLQVVGAIKNDVLDDAELSAHDKREIEENVREEVLEARQYPDISFRSTEIMRTGASYRIVGELDLRGVKKELQFTTQQRSGRMLTELTIHQPDFHITPYRALLGALRVKPDVRVEVSVPLAVN